MRIMKIKSEIVFISILFFAALFLFNGAVFSADGKGGIAVAQFGKNCGRGNLLGIQTNLENIDYSSEQAFYAEMKRYLAEAKQRKVVNNKTIAIYPETIGMWLVAAEEDAAIYSKNEKGAFLSVIARNFSPFIIKAVFAREKAKSVAAVFKLKSPLMAKIYNNTFSSLAKDNAYAIVYEKDAFTATPHHKGAALINLWVKQEKRL